MNIIDDNTLNDNQENGVFIYFSTYTTISNNDLNNNGVLIGAGIHLEGSNSSLIITNEIHGNIHGIFLIDSCFNNTLLTNTISNNDGFGIFLEQSFNNTIRENENTFNEQGIGLKNSYYNNLTGNFFDFNTLYGINFTGSFNNYLFDNNITRNGRCGALFISSNYNTIISNYFDYNAICGINLTDSSNNYFFNNNATFNMNGISLESGADNNHFFSNNISNNTKKGMYIQGSDNNIVERNMIMNNGEFGVRILDTNSYLNLFFNNSFISNAINAFDSGSHNDWNSTIGNYWDDYSGKDANDDGIGDTGYLVNYTRPYGIDYLPIWWDRPVINLTSPSNYSVFGIPPPEFILRILEGLSNTTWYTINGSSTINIFDMNTTINPVGWANLGNGSLFITFYANDSRGWISLPERVYLWRDIYAPTINVIYPNEHLLVGVEVIDFNVIIHDPHLDTMWYSLNGGANITFTHNGTFDLSAWSDLPNGTITIAFYANDTVANQGSYIFDIQIDIFIPLLVVNAPENHTLWDLPPPINLTVYTTKFSRMWYTVTGNSTKFYVDNNTEVLLNIYAWYELPQGWFIIRFYANNTVNNINDTYYVLLCKDTLAPIITIISPYKNEYERVDVVPDYQITIDEPNLDKVWYTIEGGTQKYFITSLSGKLNKQAWETIASSLRDGGTVLITFYANDTLGHVGVSSVMVIKYTPGASKPGQGPNEVPPEEEENVISPQDLAILIFLGIFGIIVFSSTLVSKRKLTEEEVIVQDKLQKKKLKISLKEKEVYFLALDEKATSKNKLRLLLFIISQAILAFAWVLIFSLLDYINEISILLLLLIEMGLFIYPVHLINKLFVKEKKLDFKKLGYTFILIGMYVACSLFYIFLFSPYFGIPIGIILSQLLICVVLIVGQFLVKFINKAINAVRSFSWVSIIVFSFLYLLEMEFTSLRVVITSLLVLVLLFISLQLGKVYDFKNVFKKKPKEKELDDFLSIRPYLGYIWITIVLLLSITIYAFTTLYLSWSWYRSLVLAGVIFYLLIMFILLENPEGLGTRHNRKVLVWTMVWCALMLLFIMVLINNNFTVLIPVLIIELMLITLFLIRPLIKDAKENKKISHQAKIRFLISVIVLSFFLIMGILIGTLLLGIPFGSLAFTILIPILILEIFLVCLLFITPIISDRLIRAKESKNFKRRSLFYISFLIIFSIIIIIVGAILMGIFPALFVLSILMILLTIEIFLSISYLVIKQVQSNRKERKGSRVKQYSLVFTCSLFFIMAFIIGLILLSNNMPVLPIFMLLITIVIEIVAISLIKNKMRYHSKYHLILTITIIVGIIITWTWFLSYLIKLNA